MSAHLAEIATQLAPGAHAILLCDGAGWHQRGGRLRVPDTLTLLPIPPYTPELVWGLRCQAEKCWSVAYPS
jgi:putative transposase